MKVWKVGYFSDNRIIKIESSRIKTSPISSTPPPPFLQLHSPIYAILQQSAALLKSPHPPPHTHTHTHTHIRTPSSSISSPLIVQYPYEWRINERGEWVKKQGNNELEKWENKGE